jgi:hypothetical protein
MARMRHSPGVHVRILVNDIPMYDRAVMTFSTPTFPATPWFQPGENELVIECREAPVNPEMALVPPHFQCLLFEQGPTVEDEETLVLEEYPTFLEKLPEDERKLPCARRTTFTPQGLIPKPIWADAAPGPVPERGSPELLKAIFDLHQAFAKRDGDALFAAGALKVEDLQRYFGNQVTTNPADLRKENEAMFAEPWDLAPFHPERLRFRSCAEGRVAYATDEHGGPAVLARHKVDPKQAWAVRPLLVRRGADWRIYR